MLNKPLPNLNLLNTFDVAGKHLSFKLAADELCVTPSAVSQQIKTLEEQLGISLFKRKNRALEFTSSGKNYWEQVHQTLDALQQHTSRLLGAQRQELRVSLMPPVANRVVLPNLSRFNELYPNINLRIDSSQKARDVARGEVDVAVRFGIPPWPNCQHVKLSEVFIQVVCPPGFTERYELDQHPENMRDVPLVTMSQSPDAWDRWFQYSDIALPQGKQHVLDNYPSAIQAAESVGAMLALMPLEKELVEAGRLEAPIPVTGPIDEAIYAVFKNETGKSKAIDVFVSWLQEEFLLL